MTVNIIDIVYNKEKRREVNSQKVNELAESIKQVGLINPIVIDKDNNLIAGLHRLEAYKILKKTEIECNIIEENSLRELVEIDENLIRHEIHYTERGDLFVKREKILSKLGAKAKIGRPKKGAKSAPFKTNKQIADSAGISKRTYLEEKALSKKLTDDTKKLIREKDLSKEDAKTLSKLNPEQQDKLISKIENGNTKLLTRITKANPTEWKHLEKKESEEKEKIIDRVIEKDIGITQSIRESVKESKRKNYELKKNKKYRVVYADPPWQYGNNMPKNYVEQADHYPLMTVEEICELPIKNITEKDAVLFLWVTSPILEESFKIINTWGFKYKASFVWDKVKHNMGHYNSVRHEFLLIAVKGSCSPDVNKLYDSVYEEERTQHSKKPEYFRSIIDELYHWGERIELFARNKAEGWDVYGNENI